jgi:hypothetical protein
MLVCQCCGSRSELDHDSIESVDPDTERPNSTGTQERKAKSENFEEFFRGLEYLPEHRRLP